MGKELKCPVCGKHGTLLLEQADINAGLKPGVKHELFECKNCEILYQDKINPSLLISFYPKSYYVQAKGPIFQVIDRLRNVGRVRAISWRAQRGRAIDIGCGAGALLKELKAQGWEPIGMDWNKNNAEIVAKSVGCFVAAGYEGLQSISGGSIQAASMMHVLEHEQDPERLLNEVHRILAPGGRAVVAVPNAASLCRYVFGPYWSGYDLPRHRRIFTPKSLEECLEANGFSVERTRGRLSDEWLDLWRSAKLACREKGFGLFIIPIFLSSLLLLPITIASALGYGSVIFTFAKRN